VGEVPAVVLLRRRRVGWALLTAAAFLVPLLMVVAPWLVRQKLVFGSWGGGGAWRTAVMANYDDLFRLDLSILSLRDYLQANQTVAALFKGYVLYRELRLLAAVVGVAGLLAVLALADRRLRLRAAPWAIYLPAALLAPALAVPYPTIKGGFWHLMPGLCPIIFVLAAGKGIELLGKSKGGPRWRRVLRWTALPLACAYLLAWWAAAPREMQRAKVPFYPPVAHAAITSLEPPPRAVLTDNSWGLYHVARVPCAQFPSDGADAALLIADSIDAEYLVTRADAPDRIPAMAEVMGHPRFRPYVSYPTDGASLLVYRILPRRPDPVQSPSDSRRSMSQ
jgi:hypothetical protein